MWLYQRPLHPAQLAPAPDYNLHPLWQVDGLKPGDKAFVDIQNDVTLDDIGLAMREGFDTVEHVKRYTTAGMGIDQGKTGNVNVIGIMAQASNKQPGKLVQRPSVSLHPG